MPKTITSDNGTEFAGHEAISKITEADFYFARPYRSCDRGLNDHTNGLIRRFLPKGTDFNEISDKEIAKIEHYIIEPDKRHSLTGCSAESKCQSI
ncbi:IS30 family transposase [Piscirickettsia salmonis]|uniref:IS30 family transposase n=1 Tax=Piscirickettsia salmonis TaxID=1238 RepID=UPI001EE36033|nr:IS30 family transposase [Piscirickettsia salmonis]